MDKFIETYNLTQLNQAAAESLNRPVTTSEPEAVIKQLPAHKVLDQTASQQILPNT